MLNKKIFALIAVLPFLLNGPVFAENSSAPYELKVEAKKVDKRANIVRSYLAKYNSTLQYQAQDFLDASDLYGVDWRLLVAISGVESTFGKHLPYNSYNAWGWGIYGDQVIYFDSWRDGIFTVAEGLSKNYLGKGLNSPAEINRIYSTSPKWGGNVTYFLNDIAQFEAKYQQDSNIVELMTPASRLTPDSRQSAMLVMK